MDKDEIVIDTLISKKNFITNINTNFYFYSIIEI